LVRGSAIHWGSVFYKRSKTAVVDHIRCSLVVEALTGIGYLVQDMVKRQ